jgi:hypothetical protein
MHASAHAYFRTDECGNVKTDLTIATSTFPRPIRFVLVNKRVPRTLQHCALCGGLIEEGYIRDSPTRLIYCDMQCFSAGIYEGDAAFENRGRKAS